jgi:CBS domain-containing protein
MCKRTVPEHAGLLVLKTVIWRDIDMNEKNSDRFLAAFRKIENYLQECDVRLRNDYNYEGFTKVLDIISENSPMVRSFKMKLHTYAKLRNAIVHDSTDEIIAEPNDKAVADIEKIADILESPPLVIASFKREVHILRDYYNISTPLSKIKENNYSQFPVYDKNNKFVGLLSERCIARWLASQVKDNFVSLSNTTIGEVLEYDETDGSNVCFISKDTTIYDALNKFTAHHDMKYSPIEAVLITEHGKESEELLGIITPWDVIEYQRAEDMQEWFIQTALDISALKKSLKAMALY